MAPNNATYEEVEAFLKEFKKKAIYLPIPIVYYDDRGKNKQALLDLEITASKRDEYVLHLTPEDYCQGPDKNKLNSSWNDVWMFGIYIKKKSTKELLPVYIKIFITNIANGPNFCISFHIAADPLSFPLKQQP